MDEFEKARFEIYLEMGLSDVEHCIDIGNLDWARKTFVQMQFLCLDYPDSEFAKQILKEAEEMLNAAEVGEPHE